jgi:hypothetical protein
MPLDDPSWRLEYEGWPVPFDRMFRAVESFADFWSKVKRHVQGPNNGA